MKQKKNRSLLGDNPLDNKGGNLSDMVILLIASIAVLATLAIGASHVYDYTMTVWGAEGWAGIRNLIVSISFGGYLLAVPALLQFYDNRKHRDMRLGKVTGTAFLLPLVLVGSLTVISTQQPVVYIPEWIIGVLVIGHIVFMIGVICLGVRAFMRSA